MPELAHKMDLNWNILAKSWEILASFWWIRPLMVISIMGCVFMRSRGKIGLIPKQISLRNIIIVWVCCSGVELILVLAGWKGFKIERIRSWIFAVEVIFSHATRGTIPSIWKFLAKNLILRSSLRCRRSFTLLGVRKRSSKRHRSSQIEICGFCQF